MTGRTRLRFNLGMSLLILLAAACEVWDAVIGGIGALLTLNVLAESEPIRVGAVEELAFRRRSSSRPGPAPHRVVLGGSHRRLSRPGRAGRRWEASAGDSGHGRRGRTQ